MASVVLDLLPGLYLALLIGLAAWALGRWFDPLPVRVQLAHAGALLLLFAPVLFAGKVLLPLELLRYAPPFRELPPTTPHAYANQGDQLYDMAPYLVATRRTLRELEWPLLNPLVGAGEPLLVNSQAQHFHPFVLLTDPFPLAAAVGLIAALKVWTALASCYLFCRRLRLGEGAALAASLAYGLCGFVLLYLGWPHTHSAAFFPAVLYALDRCLGQPARGNLGLLAGCLVGLMLGGHPETVVYVLGAAAVFTVVRMLQRPHASIVRSAAAVGAVGVLTAGLLAPLLLPTWMYLPSTLRHKRVADRLAQRPPILESLRARLGNPEARAAEARELVRRVVPVAAPNAFGNDRYGHYWGPTTVLQDASGFAGTAALLGALLAVWPERGRRRLPGEPAFLFLGAVAFAVVVQLPGLDELLLQLPILRQSASYNRRLTMVLAFCCAVLAGCTWERWRLGGLRRSRLLGVALLLGGVLVWAHVGLAHPDNPRIGAGLRAGSLAVQLAVLAASTVLLWRPPGEGWRRHATWGVALLVGVELLFFHRPMNPAMPRTHYFPTPPSVAFLQRHAGSDRMAGLGRAFPYNVPVIYGIADVRSGNPLQPADLFVLTRPLREGWYSWLKVADHPMYDLLGVRYLMTAPGAQLAPPARLVYRGEAWIYERSGTLPRLFLPSSAEVLPAHLLLPRLWTAEDFRRWAAVSAVPDGAAAWRAAGGSSRLRRLTVADTRVSASAELSERRLLASSLYQDGGWRLLVDGAPHPTVRTDLAFVGAWVEAGQHSLELLYRPVGFLPGCVVGGLALALLTAWLTPPPRRGRPERRPPFPAGELPPARPADGRLLIIQIPCLNEEESLPATLAALPRELPGIDAVEWMVIDDGSTDRTVEVARALGVDHVVRMNGNQGLARAFMAGLVAAAERGADYIVSTDADNQYAAEDIGKLVAPLLSGEADLVIGSRPIATIRHFSPWKRLLQRLGTGVVRRLSGTHVQDAPSGFRAFTRDAALRLNVFSNYTYTLETILQAGHSNLRLVDVPIRVTGPTRPSRLIRSVPRYVARSVGDMLSTYLIYRPSRIFGLLAVAFLTPAAVLAARYLVLAALGAGKGHVQSVIASGVLGVCGVFMLAIGIVAHLLGINRRLLEEIRYLERVRSLRGRRGE